MVGGGKDEVMNGFDVFEGALLSTVSGYIYIYMILYDLICIDIKYSSQLYSQNRTFDSVTFFYKLQAKYLSRFSYFYSICFLIMEWIVFTTYPSKRANESFGEKTNKKV